MPDISIIYPKIKPKHKVDKSVSYGLASKVVEESQVIVHCTYKGTIYGDMIRIWKSTFLIANDSNHRSKLVHHENITIYPEWTEVENGKTITFTLIFTALPKNCLFFDFIESIPEPGGFEVKNIRRNKTDVYKISLNL